MAPKRKRYPYSDEITSVGHNDDMPFDLEEEEDYGLVKDVMDRDWESLDSLDSLEEFDECEEDSFDFDDEEDDLLEDCEE